MLERCLSYAIAIVYRCCTDCRYPLKLLCCFLLDSKLRVDLTSTDLPHLPFKAAPTARAVMMHYIATMLNVRVRASLEAGQISLIIKQNYPQMKNYPV